MHPVLHVFLAAPGFARPGEVEAFEDAALDPAFKLLLVGVFHDARVDVEADVLRLTMADGDLPALKDEIRTADLD